MAINGRAHADQVKVFLTEEQIVEDSLIFLDCNDNFYQSIGVFSAPETLFIDGDSQIITHELGLMALNKIRSLT